MPSKSKELIRLIENIKNLDDAKPEDVLKILSQLKIEEKERIYNDEYIEQLKSTKQNFLKIHNFNEGDIVKWKIGLKNRKLPRKNQPAIVLEILTTPIYDDYSSGTPYFREPLDIALGIIDDGNDFMVFYYDKRRFELYYK